MKVNRRINLTETQALLLEETQIQMSGQLVKKVEEYIH